MRESLEYRDHSVEFDLRRLKKSAYQYAQDPEGYAERVAKMTADQVKSMIFSDLDGYWTHSGLANRAAELLQVPVERAYGFPDPSPLRWRREPPHEPWLHQDEAKRALLAARHGAVEVAPGLGKSDVIEALVREIGLKALVGAPSLSIAEQLYDQMKSRLGSESVGRYFDGHKEPNKLVVIGTSGSFAQVKESSRDWKLLRSSRVFIADESHMWAARSLSSVALGLAALAEYRWFLSGTQMRGDGADLLLEGITGPVVYWMDTKQGVAGGYLAEPKFRLVTLGSRSNYQSGDAARMTREHLYRNPAVLGAAADLANRFVSTLKRPTLILIDEVEQFSLLLPLLRFPVAFAHGALQETTMRRGHKVAGNASKVPESYRDSDPKKLVAEFNEGKWPILIGTSCVSTGTDLRANEATIYLVGGKSEVAVRQAVGRGTRGGEKRAIKNPWTGQKKLDFFHVDFDVENIPMLHRHAKERRSIYREVIGKVEEMRWDK